MIIRSTADAGFYQVIGIQLLEGVLLPGSSPVILRELEKSAQHGAGWEGKVRWVHHALPCTFSLKLCDVLYEEDWVLSLEIF